eukprot:GEMP01032627.1.p1 GENE.GEMP01032627.1~~GEMP01032627.1.p1  ORF type:complete len:182 (+),score=24.90 GEMP01032627.1:62-547(+)
MANRFLDRNAENADLNQYWYSAKTIDVLVQEIEALKAWRTAFLSTPSIFFSLSEDFRQRSHFFDIDEKWKDHPNFVRYDFNEPLALADELRESFELVIIDPPFITLEVWQKYAQTCKFLLKPGGKIILSTIMENETMMRDLLDVHPVKFMPSIPHLVYQCI